MVAGPDRRDLGADRLNHTRTLVTQHDRTVERKPPDPVDDMQIAVAHAGGDGADQHLARPGFVDFNRFDRQRFVHFAEYSGGRFHDRSSAKPFGSTRIGRAVRTATPVEPRAEIGRGRNRSVPTKAVAGSIACRFFMPAMLSMQSVPDGTNPAARARREQVRRRRVRSRSARVWEAKMTGEPPGTLPRTPSSGAAALSPWSVKREAAVGTNDDRPALSVKPDAMSRSSGARSSAPRRRRSTRAASRSRRRRAAGRACSPASDPRPIAFKPKRWADERR